MFSTLLRPKPVGKYIVFEDPEAERVLMAHGVSSDGIGITLEDAERVTSLQNWFQNNATITSFNELRYFKNLTTLKTIPFLNCTSLQSIDVSNIVAISASAFNGCSALAQDMHIEKVTGELGQGAFRYAGITRLYAPNATSCGTNLCESCTNLEYADISSMVTMGAFAFQFCSNLKEVKMGAIKTLGVQTFYTATSLTKVDVPSTIESIGNACFMYCSALKEVIIRATTPPSLEARAFQQTTCAIYVPDASLEAYKTATNWNAYADRIRPISEIEDYYVSDALLMHLDGINKGNVEGEWQDLVSGNSFVNHGAIAEADGWRFDGASSYMDSTTLINKGWWQSKRTMEVVVVFDDITPAKTEVVFMGRKNCFAFGKYLNEHFVNTADYSVTSMKNQHENNVVIYGFSLDNEKSPQGIVNGKKLVTDISNAFVGGDANIAFLGKRAAGSHFKGKIYAIRLHDRVLTEEEILYNQRIDNKRFNLGLDI